MMSNGTSRAARCSPRSQASDISWQMLNAAISAAWMPGDTQILCATWNKRPHRVLDATLGERVQRLEAQTDASLQPQSSADGRPLPTAAQNRGNAKSPDGRLLATRHNGRIDLWMT